MVERVPSGRCAALAGLVTIASGAAWAAGTSPPLSAQVVASASLDSVTVVPGAAYEASALYRALAGSGYRDLWTTHIRVPVADLDRLGGGGLRPVEVGGGTTTQTLHLRGADERRYVFRSVDKIPRELIEDLEGTPAAAIIQDQMSSFHPSAAPVVARLLDAVGVLHPEPTFMVVPDDPGLGEFREQFAGMLVLFEERPDDLPDGRPGFAGSRRIIQTDDLFDELEDDPEHRVALTEFLKSRLVDLLVGDRDRSVNNHLWAGFDEDGRYIWRPIPRDRDQSFVRFDGLLKALARRYERRLVTFSDEYSSTLAVTRNAWDMDRNFLVGLDGDSWDATVREVVAALTDEVIHDAVRRMPREHVAVVGREMEEALRRRRSGLPAIAEEFYGIVFGYADVHATDVDEVAFLDVEDDGSVRVTVVEEGDERVAAHFDRTFSPAETREVRLYLHGGDDRAVLRGAGVTPITLRVLGGGGADRMVGEGGAQAIFYDDGDQTVVDGSNIRRVDDSPSRPFSWFEESYELDWGSLTLPRPGLAYDSDRGLVPLAGVRYIRYGFDRRPYRYRLDLQGGWAFAHAEPVVEASLRLRRAVAGLDLDLDASFSGIEVVNFFGLGNEIRAPGGDDFYAVHQEQLLLSAGLGFGDGESWQVGAGPVYKRVVSDTTDAGNLLAEVGPRGSGTVAQVGLRVRGSRDARDRAGTPSSGYRLEGGLAYYPGVPDDEVDFGVLDARAAGYFSLPGGNPTLAVGGGAKKVWGDFPYYEAAFLGGTDGVRGLPEERYAGDASLHGSVEARAFLARLTFIVPVDMGVFAFADVGRVYLDGEESTRWHTGRGGGLWFAPLTRTSTVRVSLARAEGRTVWYGGMGFAF